MKVINFYASPGSGKTLISASIFVELKKIFSNVEINLEYAKILIDENRLSVLQDNQLYVFAKQEKRLHDLLDKNIDYVITDSPILLSTIYNNPEKLDQEIFERLAFHVYNKYENINFFLRRNSNYGHDPRGRRHSLEESIELDERILKMLNENNIPYYEIYNDQKAISKIMEVILKEHMGD